MILVRQIIISYSSFILLYAKETSVIFIIFSIYLKNRDSKCIIYNEYNNLRYHTNFIEYDYFID